MERIAIIGLGNMGAALAAHGVACSFEVTGWTRSGGDVAKAEQGGYRLADSLADCVASGEILMLSLFDDHAVQAVVAQLAELDLTGKLVVDTSTVNPRIYGAAHEAILAAGGHLIDAPISGGPEMVRAGSMGLFIGGAEADVARFLPIAKALSNRVAAIAGLGSGAAAKIVNNAAMAGAFRAGFDAVKLGRAMGLELDTIMGFLENSPGVTPAFRSRIPMMTGKDDTVGFSIDGAVEDQRMFVAVARDHGVEIPAVDRLRADFESAQAAGLGAKDIAAVLLHILGETPTE